MRTLKDNLNKFLKNDNDKVMLVTGVWGVGKTYQVVDEWAKKEETLKDKFKVVTLFGCEKIDSLIWDILVGVGGINIIKNCIGLVNIIVDKLFGVNIPPETIIKSIPTVSKKIKSTEQILIIDDIERKNDSITLKEILNLVESIKHNFKKIILIMDRTKIKDEDYKYLNDYFERIIDRHYEIKEPSEEAKHSILTEIDNKYYNDLDILDVKNLRTLQKLNSFAYELNNSPIKDKPQEIKILYCKLYLFAYRMVKNNEFTAQDYAEKEKLFINGLLLSENKKSEYEKIKDEEENFNKQLFIYSHYSEAYLLTRQVSNQQFFNKVLDLEDYFNKFIEAIKSGDIESIFDINISFSHCPKNIYEYTPIIHEIDDIKNMFNNIETVISKDEYDPVSVYINYLKFCTFNCASYYENNKKWFDNSFINVTKAISKYVIENKYIYAKVSDLALINKYNNIGNSIKNIMDIQLEKIILNSIEKELKNEKSDYTKINKLFEPYKVYQYVFNRYVDKDRFMEVGKKLICRIFTNHLEDFYSSYFNVYANCFYNYIDVPYDIEVKNELIKYARECGYKE